MSKQPVEIETPADRKAADKRARTLRRWFGRPTAAQNRLLERLLAALVVDFEEEGTGAIKAVRQNDPVNYLRLIAVMVRKSQSDLSAGRRFNDDDVFDALTTLNQIAAVHSLSFGRLDAES